MTAEEAIKSLHNLNLVLSITESERDAVSMAIEALEKQIAKKPVRKNPLCYAKLLNGEERYAYDFHCPACDAKLKLCEHHCTCGQALDWRVEE